MSARELGELIWTTWLPILVPSPTLLMVALSSSASRIKGNFQDVLLSVELS